MQLLENISLRPKTTMRIGGTARYFAELRMKQDVEEAVRSAEKNNLPLIPLGSGSNTIFADGTITALIVQVKYEEAEFLRTLTLPSPLKGRGSIPGSTLKVGAGKNLAMLINELAEKGLDLSALTGIPGTVGGAIFGNAGQGPKGIWIDSFVESVEAYVDGEWKMFTKEQCEFRYRESGFKDMTGKFEVRSSKFEIGSHVPIIWEATLAIPSGEPAAIKANIEALLRKRIETQPHLKTAGSCFKAVGETPVWQLIDAAGLRGFNVGGVEIAQKHANFLLNVGEAKFSDAVAVVDRVKEAIPENLEVEMRFYRENGALGF